MANTFMLRLNWCGLEGGASPRAWLQLPSLSSGYVLSFAVSSANILKLLFFSATIPLSFSSLSQDCGPHHNLQIQVAEENPCTE